MLGPPFRAIFYRSTTPYPSPTPNGKCDLLSKPHCRIQVHTIAASTPLIHIVRWEAASPSHRPSLSSPGRPGADRVETDCDERQSPPALPSTLGRSVAGLRSSLNNEDKRRRTRPASVDVTSLPSRHSPP